MADEIHDKPLFLQPIKTTAVSKHTDINTALNIPGNYIVDNFSKKQTILPTGIIVSREHGRSTSVKELTTPILEIDEFKTPFGSVDWKGNRLENVVIQKDEYSIAGLDLLGIMLGSYIPRIIDASNLARSIGVPTERILKVEKIAEMPWQGQYIPIQEWKSLTIKAWEEKLAKEPDALGFKDKDESMKRIHKLLAEDFVIVTRQTQVRSRLSDLMQTDSLDEINEELQSTFRWLSAVKQYLPNNILVQEYPNRTLRATEEVDRIIYFGEILPSNMGTVLGMLHSKGIAVVFPHFQNWQTVGALVDTDSWHGNPLGDNSIKQEDIEKDVRETKSMAIDYLSILGNRDVFGKDRGSDPVLVNFMVNYYAHYYLARISSPIKDHSAYEEILLIAPQPEERHLLKQKIYAKADSLLKEKFK